MWKMKFKASQLREEIQRRILIEYRKRKKPKVVNIEGIKIPVTEDLSGGPLEALYGGYYEKNELRLIKSELHQNDIVMELGTGLKKIGSERVFTYEANPSLEPHIFHTYSLNQVAPNLKICLLGDKPGEQTFYIRRNFWASSIIQRSQNDKAIKVPVKSFNQEVQQINPTFIIIDIEGGEYELLKHANFHNIQKIVLELHKSFIGSEKTQFVMSRLAEAGFQLNKQLSYEEELFLQRV